MATLQTSWPSRSLRQQVNLAVQNWNATPHTHSRRTQKSPYAFSPRLNLVPPRLRSRFGSKGFSATRQIGHTSSPAKEQTCRADVHAKLSAQISSGQADIDDTPVPDRVINPNQIVLRHQDYDMSVLVVDGTNIACTAHEAAKRRKTDAIEEFKRELQRLQVVQDLLHPKRCIVVFDGGRRAQGRQQVQADYKQKRNEKMLMKNERDGIKKRGGQGPGKMIIQAVKDFGADVALAPIGWEGDDVIATICGRMAVYAGGGAGLVAVVSNDSDMQQLLRKDKVVWVSQMPAKSQKYPDRIVLETEESFVAKYRFPPEQYAVFLALAGKPEAGVKGLPGVGEKSAKKLVQRFGSVESMFSARQRGDAFSPQTLKALSSPEAQKQVNRCMEVVKLSENTDLLPPELDLAWPN